MITSIWNGATCVYCDRKRCTSCFVAQQEEFDRQRKKQEEAGETEMKKML